MITYKVKNPVIFQKLIRQTGMNNGQFARKIGFTRVYLSAVLHQRSNVSKPVANFIALLLNVTRDDIFLDSSVAKSETKSFA
ncbi:helix-turn-helix domain-containing protein [Apilactobacillus xinyiensis]|uniref:helix-turn-helix domain-containing protein n=1 Tax=Apilactobacillus xinyiensis TaxID=2841032 RepID=UPI00200C5846|nr:helix-turn-helix transcriptional regulator [Apilactobacillus xinyiensis]MCL0330666.1 helix-turn-helix domain-containing protein [Apilactobacillus xinyiensis]